MNKKIISTSYCRSTEDEVIDFRSDTVTKPSIGMRTAMANAKVGDDVYNDDPTVNELEDKVAEILGKKAGLFVTSGTQSNLCAMLAHCQRGEEIITGDKYHVFADEAAGASVLGSIAIAPVKTNIDGSIDVNRILNTIKPDDSHCPISKVLSLENTVSGKVQSMEVMNRCAFAAKKSGLSVHLDGARLMNAAVKLDVSVNSLVENVDSVSLCLSKGLGAPVGSVLVGSKKFIRKARRIRKLVGGGLRQSGILASAGLYALENNVNRLQIDHENALVLAKRLKKVPKISLKIEDVQTNMVFITIPTGLSKSFQDFCYNHKILINIESEEVRLVTHMGIDKKKIEYFVDKLHSFF